MKKIFLLLIVMVPYCLMAQNTYSGNQGHYDVLTFFGANSFGNGGFTVTTKIPSNERHATTVYIKGFDNVARTIGLQISWFYTGDEFRNISASSTGGWIPEKTNLDNSGQFIQIHFEGFSDLQNLEVIALADKIYDASWFTDWTMDDIAGGGISLVYNNRFGEAYTQNLYSDGVVNGYNSNITNNLIVGQGTNGGINTTNLTVSINERIYGKLGIGATLINPAVPLHTQGGVRFEGVKNAFPNNQVLSTDVDGNLIKVNNGGFWQTHTNASTIVYNGTVGIGITPSTLLNTTTTNPTPYKLVVGGTIGATKVKVTQGGWADYVFADNYKLQPLKEIEKFVKTNKHLEGVPTEKEVKENGVDIGDTQVILLKKIEELTLHLIEQNKKIEKLEKLVSELKKN